MVNKKPNPKKILIYTILALSAFSGVGLIFNKIYPPKSSQIAVITTPSGSVDLSISGPSPRLTVGQEYDLTFAFKTTTAHFTAIQASISYDPSYFSIISVTPSSLLSTTLQPVKIESSKINFTYGVDPELGGFVGSNTIATLRVKPLKSGTTAFTLNDDTIATVIESDTNAIATVANPSFTLIKLISGDLTKDGVVNIFDFQELLLHYGTTYTIFDFNNILTNFGKTG